MNCVVFNHDGSVKNLSFQDIIVQGNTGVDDVYVAVEGYSNDAYTGIALFTLPNGDMNSLIGATASFSVDGSQYSGYKFTLNSQQTTLAGLVEMSIRLDSASFERQMSVTVTLTINKSGYSPEYTEITMGQYEAMLRTIATLQPKYTLNNVRHYEYLSDAVDDENDIAIGQCVLVSQAPNGPAFYKKDGEEGLVWLCPCGQTFLTFDEEVSTSTADENIIFRDHPENVVVVHDGNYLYYIGPDESDEEIKYYQSIPNNLGEYWICEVGTTIGGTASVEFTRVSAWELAVVDITYSQLVEKRNNGQLVEGRRYRITDYQCTTTAEDTSSANNQFDIVVTALSPYTLSEDAKAMYHQGLIHFSESDLNAWELKYCLDNDTLRFDWADATNGKGVIYFMKDEFGNEAPYDFKNIRFSVSAHYITKTDEYTFQLSSTSSDAVVAESGTTYTRYPGNDKTVGGVTYLAWVYSGSYIYTKSGSNERGDPYYYANFDTPSGKIAFFIPANSNVDASMVGASNNVIKPYFKDAIQFLNRISLRTSDQAYPIRGNEFGANCHDIYTTTRAYGVSVGEGTSGIYAIGGFIESKIGAFCTSLYFTGSITQSTFGVRCHDIEGAGIAESVFGDMCGVISLGNDANHINFGNECYNIQLGDFVRYVTFGNDCSYIKIGSGAGTVSRVEYVTIGDHCAYLYLNSADTDASASNYLKNVTVWNNVRGSSSASRYTLTVSDRNLSYETVFKMYGSVEVAVGQ